MGAQAHDGQVDERGEPCRCGSAHCLQTHGRVPQEYAAAREAPPLNHLDDVFFETDSFPRPPELHYGVPLPEEWVLEVAEEHELTVYYGDVPSARTGVERLSTFRRVIRKLAIQTGLDPSAVTVLQPLNSDLLCIISIMTNYSVVGEVPLHNMEALAEFFDIVGVEGTAKWYLCSLPTWCPKDEYWRFV
jgi:hypothetical protein